MAEIDVLKAKLDAHGSKHANLRAEAEVELLKRKSANGADPVKTKDPKAPIDNGWLTPRDTLALKQKLCAVETTSGRADEARADGRPGDRATAPRARLMAAAEASGSPERLRDPLVVIGRTAFFIAGGATALLLAVYVESFL